MGNPQGVGFYKHGRYSGWTEFRYGTGKPVKLAPSPLGPIFTPGKRKHLIGKLIDEMQDWRLSPFEREGPLRASMRAVLCLDGNAWARSDDEALFLLRCAFAEIGAERPTWAQGQREYTESPDHCTRCGKPVAHEGNRSTTRYCSALCASATLQTRQFDQRRETDKAYAAAMRVLKKARTIPRKCVECGGEFRPISERSEQSACSYKCAAIVRARKKPAPTIIIGGRGLECSFCGEPFTGYSIYASLCSRACKVLDFKLRHGTAFPRQLKRHVFDHFFTVPINAAPRRLTPLGIDWFFMERGLRITMEPRMAA